MIGIQCCHETEAIAVATEQWRLVMGLFVGPNPQAFLRMGACQGDSPSERHFSRWLVCQSADTLLGRHAHTLFILCAAAGHLPIHVHPGIHTHTENSVTVWCGAQTMMTVSALRVIEVMWVQTGWGLSSNMSERKLRWGRIGGVGGGWLGGQLSSSRAVYPSIGLCVYLTSSWWSFVSSLCLQACFNLSAILPCLSLGPLFFFYLNDGWINFALSSLWQSLHPGKQCKTHK